MTMLSTSAKGNTVVLDEAFDVEERPMTEADPRWHQVAGEAGQAEVPGPSVPEISNKVSPVDPGPWLDTAAFRAKIDITAGGVSISGLVENSYNTINAPDFAGLWIAPLSSFGGTAYPGWGGLRQGGLSGVQGLHYVLIGVKLGGIGSAFLQSGLSFSDSFEVRQFPIPTTFNDQPARYHVGLEVYNGSVTAYYDPTVNPLPADGRRDLKPFHSIQCGVQKGNTAGFFLWGQQYLTPGPPNFVSHSSIDDIQIRVFENPLIENGGGPSPFNLYGLLKTQVTLYGLLNNAKIGP